MPQIPNDETTPSGGKSTPEGFVQDLGHEENENEDAKI